MRMYHANAAIPPARHARRVQVPSGFSLFPADIGRPPRRWLERTANVVRLTGPPRGGHFAPFEEPELCAQELGVLAPLPGSGKLRQPRADAAGRSGHTPVPRTCPHGIRPSSIQLARAGSRQPPGPAGAIKTQDPGDARLLPNRARQGPCDISIVVTGQVGLRGSHQAAVRI